MNNTEYEQHKKFLYSEERFQSLLGQAEHFLDIGLIPIPLRGKVPVGKNWEDTTKENALQMIKRSWAQFIQKSGPYSQLFDIDKNGKQYRIFNIGVLCGPVIGNDKKEVENGLIVIDIDVKDDGLATWKELIATYTEPQTFIVRTGSGGLHYYFKWTKKVEDLKSTSKVISKNGKDVGIDIKTGQIAEQDGLFYVVGRGQVVAPGSTHPLLLKPYFIINKSPISCMPDWLTNILLEASKRKEKTKSRKSVLLPPSKKKICLKNNSIFFKSNNENAVKKRKAENYWLLKYYEKELDWKYLWDLLTPKSKDENESHYQREFVFQIEENYWMEPQTFPNSQKLKESVLTLFPLYIHMRGFKSIEEGNPYKRELYFDYDINENCKGHGPFQKENVRPCCSGKNWCKRCWFFVSYAILFIKYILSDYLGINPETVRTFFSGTKGVHIFLFGFYPHKDFVKTIYEWIEYKNFMNPMNDYYSNKAYPIARKVFENYLLQSDDFSSKIKSITNYKVMMEKCRKLAILSILHPVFDENVKNKFYTQNIRCPFTFKDKNFNFEIKDPYQVPTEKQIYEPT